VVLAAASQVFLRDLPVAEGDLIKTPMVIPGVKYTSLLTFIQSLYTGEAEMTADNFSDLSDLARLYNVPFVLKLVDLFLQAGLSEENALAMYKAYGSGLPFIGSHPALLETEEFLDLPLDRIIGFASSDDVSLSEVVIWKAVVAWGTAHVKKTKVPRDAGEVKVSPTVLKEVLSDVLPLIRLNLLTQAELSTVVVPSGLIEGSSIVKAFTYAALQAKGTPDPHSVPWVTRPRKRGTDSKDGKDSKVKGSLDLSGCWGDEGSSITQSSSGALEITMGSRPNASGSFTSPTTISVTFPDDATYTGTVNSSGTLISWSNGTAWRKS